MDELKKQLAHIWPQARKAVNEFLKGDSLLSQEHQIAAMKVYLAESLRIVQHMEDPKKWGGEG